MMNNLKVKGFQRKVFRQVESFFMFMLRLTYVDLLN